MRKALLSFTLLMAMAGCAAQVPSPPPQQTLQQPAPTNVLIATQLAGPDTYLPPMPTAVLLLTKSDLSRNKAICTAFFASFPTVSGLAASSLVAQNIIATRWPIKTDEPTSTSDCSYLTDPNVYNYDLAETIIQKTGANSKDSGAPNAGPYIVALFPSSSNEVGNAAYIAISGSSVPTANMAAFMQNWSDTVKKAATNINNAVTSASNTGATAADASTSFYKNIYNLIVSAVEFFFPASGPVINGITVVAKGIVC